MADSPRVVVVAGPNGAGKTTAAPFLLRGVLGVEQFVNADTIARGLSGFSPQSVAFEAGRIMLARLTELAARRADFAFETTLASRSFATRLKALREAGYYACLVFLALPSPEFAVARVRERAALGGHDVPADVVTRRFHRGLRNLIQLYLPLVDHWRIYDNSQLGEPRLIAQQQRNRDIMVVDATAWATIRKPGANA